MQHGTDEELSSINSVPSTKGRRVFTTGYGMIRSAASLRSAFSPMSDILDQHSFRDWGNRFTVLVETSKETRTRILRTLSLVHLGQTPLPPQPWGRSPPNSVSAPCGDRRMPHKGAVEEGIRRLILLVTMLLAGGDCDLQYQQDRLG